MKKIILSIALIITVFVSCACLDDTKTQQTGADAPPLTSSQQTENTDIAQTAPKTDSSPTEDTEISSDSNIYTTDKPSEDDTVDNVTDKPTDTASENITFSDTDVPTEDTVIETSAPSDNDIETETEEPTTQHSHSYFSSVVKPTCTSGGYTTYTCTDCGHSYRDNSTSAKGHSYKSTVKAPTCTSGGYTTYTCTACGHSYQGNSTSAKGHSYKSTVKAPTCTNGGYTTYTCTACGHSYQGNSTSAKGHSYKSTVKAPTCTSGGYTTYTCTACGHSYQGNTTSAKGHTWGEWVCVKEPTYSSQGLKERTCRACGSVTSEKIPVLSMSTDQMIEEVLRLVNEERAKNGASPLSYLYTAQAAADIRAVETSESFSHTRPNGSSCFTVLDEHSVNYFAAGENIAAGYPTPEAVVNGWMNSEGHRANILNKNYTHIIIGVYETDTGYGIYWVQLFVRLA